MLANFFILPVYTLCDGKGPVIKPAALSRAYGEFTTGKGAKEIRLDKDLLKKQGKAKGEDKKDYQFLTAVTALHEDTHRGDNKDGVDCPGEEGELMEAAAFGAVVDETNMKAVRKTIKKKRP